MQHCFSIAFAVAAVLASALAAAGGAGDAATTASERAVAAMEQRQAPPDPSLAAVYEGLQQTNGLYLQALRRAISAEQALAAAQRETEEQRKRADDLQNKAK